MLRLIFRGVGLFVLIFLLVSAGGFASAADDTGKNLKNTDETMAAMPSDTAASDAPKSDENGASESAPTVSGVPAAQDAASDKKNANDDSKPAPKFTPMLATTGTIGLFTLETADTLPKHGFAFSAFGNKFGRMPGSVTVLEFGVDLSYGITDKLNFYAAFDPYGHVHIGCPGQLSLRSIPLSSTCASLAFGTAG